MSVRRQGDPKLGTRAEIKNVNSFRFLERAIQYEIHRQIELIEDGGKVVQETRLYDADRDETRSMRSKEDAMDYRYFPDPDLLPLVITAAQIEAIKATMPESPRDRQERLVNVLRLSTTIAQLLTTNRATADFYDDLQGGVVDALGYTSDEANQLCANWMVGPLFSRLNLDNISIEQSPIGITEFVTLILRILDGSISRVGAKRVFEEIWNTPQNQDATRPLQNVDALIKQMGLEQVSDSGSIEKMIDEVLAANKKSVDEFKSGKEKAFQSLVGQVMKASQGKANPAQVNEILKVKLS